MRTDTNPESFSFPNRMLRQQFSSPTTSTRRGMSWDRTCCTMRRQRRPTGRTTTRSPASPVPTAWRRFAKTAVPTASSRPTRRRTTCVADNCCRWLRCAAALHPTWRGRISSVPRPPARGPSQRRGCAARAYRRVVHRGSGGERDRCDQASAGSGTCWCLGTFARQGRQGRRRVGGRRAAGTCRPPTTPTR